MSDPTTTQSTITVTTHLDNDPKHAEQLGHISVAWAQLEWNMYLLFEIISGSPPAVARSMWNAIESTRGRREIISSISRVLIDNTSENNILDDILRRIRQSAGQRNKYVHDTWGVANTQKHEIFQVRDSHTTQKMEEVTIPDMQAIVIKIRELAEELHLFRERIVNKVPEWLEKHRNLPGLGMHWAPKGNPPGWKKKGHHGP